MKISILLPTRNHPDKLLRLFESITANTSNISDIEICCRIDNDDIVSMDAINEFKKSSLMKFRILVGDRDTNYGTYWNDAYSISTGDLLMMCGDDFIFETPNWDVCITQVFEKKEDKLLLVFGEDGIQHGGIATHAFIHRTWVDILGYYAPMVFKSFFHDTWLDNIASQIGRKVYVPELKFTHLHRGLYPDTNDDIGRQMDLTMNDDHGVYLKTASFRAEDADKLRRHLI